MVLLTVITPVFNNVTYISLAIENYLSQQCAYSELLIMDGGSTDGTKEVIAQYARDFPSIRWVSEKDKGQSDAMNKGIGLAKGKYISFLNVDDYYSDGCLNEVCQILNEKSDINYLVGDCNVWDQTGNLIYVNRPSKVKKYHVFSGHHFSVNPSAYFYQKRLHDQVGLYPLDNYFNMDLEMILRLRNVTTFHYYSKIWGNFRMLPNAKTFEDQFSNQLENRKQDLLIKYLAKQSIWVQFFTNFYKLERKYFPIINGLIHKVIDKIKYEFQSCINDKLFHKR
jgi:glycosyltransferase involved in cell wall biosynthesis